MLNQFLQVTEVALKRNSFAHGAPLPDKSTSVHKCNSVNFRTKGSITQLKYFSENIAKDKRNISRLSQNGLSACVTRQLLAVDDRVENGTPAPSSND